MSSRSSAMPSGVAWLTKKSRASGSASASQVTTLMPLPRALRSTVEIPSRFSTLTAIDVDAAGDPGLDDLVLLGRVGVGRAVPDQLDAQLLRRLLGALAAADEVGVALALGHHRDGDGCCRRCRAAAGASASPEPPHATVSAASATPSPSPADASVASSSFSYARLPRGAEPDRGEQQHAGQHAGQLRRQIRQTQAVLRARRARTGRAACRRRCRGRRRSTCRRAPRP